MLQVRLLGQFDVRVDSQPAVISSRAGQSLLAYLMVTAGTPHRREKLAGVFWPDTSDENARGRLRHELWSIRKALSAATAAADFIVADELTITFNPEAEYILDVAQLEQELPADGSLDERVRQAGLYHGELLPGFYDEWIVLERARVQAVFERRMQQLLERLIAESRWKMTLEWSEHWLAFGEMPEPAYRAMMLAYSALGDRSKVAATYDRCVAMLAQELEVMPSEETTSLRDRLLRGEGVARVDLSATHVASAQSRSFDEPPTPGEPPFKGLQAFEETDADRFFGRELLTAQLIGRLRESRFLAVIVGASGSGKSSIVRAGLIPQLKRGGLLADGTQPPAGSPHWQVHVITPTAHPLEALAVSLTRGTESVTAAATLAEDLARDARSLRLFVRRSLEASASAPHLLLVVDQFEELFTLCRSEFEREAFIDNLIATIEPGTGGGLTLVLTLRADFYAHLASYPELRDAVARQQEYIGPMTAEELRRAIEEPAKLGGWDFQPGLVDVLLRDVGDEPGALPLLSHALLETWQRRSGRTLTLQGYAETGGVRGAIAHTAETVYRTLSPDQQHLARLIFVRLTELGEGTEDTRRRASLRELMAQSDQAGEVRAVLNTLAQARLITLSEETAEVAHEALIRAWPTLREWLNADREGLLLHRRLTEAAYDWELLERDPGALYRGARLAQATEWAAANPAALNNLEQAFLAASQEQEQHEAVEREVQRQRELQAAQKLAETERARADSELRRAEEQRRSANRLRRRNRVIAAAGGMALLLAVLAGAFGAQSNQNAAQAQTNLIAAQAESDRANQARDTAVAAQATAQAEAVIRATAQAKAEAQTRLATGRELAAAALDNLTVDSERSLLLALHAANSTYAFDQTVLPEARQALHQALLASHARLTLTGHQDAVLAVAYSPDGQRLASLGRDGTIKVWDVTDGRELLSLSGHTEFTDAYGLQRLAYSRDGRRLVAGDADRVRVLDAASGQELLNLAGHTADVWAVAFSPDGQRIASGGVDKTVRLWDAATGELLFTLNAHTNPIEGLDFSSDGTLLATAGDDGAVKLWGSTTGELLYTWQGPLVATSVKFSPDGKYLAFVQGNGFKLYQVDSRQLVLDKPLDGILSITYSMDGKRVAITMTRPEAQVLDATTGEPLLKLYGHVNDVNSAAFSPDGERLATASGDGTVKVWDITPDYEVTTYSALSTDILTADFSQDWSQLLTVDPNGFKIWNAATGALLREFNTSPSPVWNWTLAGNHLVTVDSKHLVTILDFTSGKELAALQFDPDIADLRQRITPDGKYAAISGNGGNLGLWEVATGQKIRTLTGHTDSVKSMAFSPDGLRLASASADRSVKIWEVASGRELLHIPIPEYPGAIDFSPDGKHFVTGHLDGSASVWDAATGQKLLTLPRRGSELWVVNYSPDGKAIVTNDLTGIPYLWDATTGEELQMLPGLTAFRYPISPDGTRFVVLAKDGSVQVLYLDIEDLIALAQARVTRSLSAEECQKYLHVEACP